MAPEAKGDHLWDNRKVTSAIRFGPLRNMETDMPQDPCGFEIEGIRPPFKAIRAQKE